MVHWEEFSVEWTLFRIMKSQWCDDTNAINSGAALALSRNFLCRVSAEWWLGFSGPFFQVQVLTLRSVNGAGKKLKNGQTFDDSMKEAMQYLQKDVSIMLQPETISRNLLTNGNVNRVKILDNTKIKIPGSIAVPYVASILTILVLSYK